MADLSTTLAGIPLEHPVVLASGPLSSDGEAIVRAHRAGAAAVVTKTISCRPARNPIPHLRVTEQGILNCELWSDIGADQWIHHELPLAKESGAIVIASIGPAVRDVQELARAVWQAGADALEVVSYNPAELPRMSAEAADRAGVPVLAKVNALWPRLGEIAAECREQGAQAITAVDSIGPALRIDVQRRRPLLGSPACWLSGPALLSIALQAVAVVHQATGGPVVATGGVSSGKDALEMMMAGGTAVGVCSFLLLKGLHGFATLRAELDAELVRAGFSTSASAIGAALPALAAAPGSRRMQLVWSWELCTECGRCVELCPYAARSEPGRSDWSKCRLCGLCASVCPTGALLVEEESL